MGSRPPLWWPLCFRGRCIAGNALIAPYGNRGRAETPTPAPPRKLTHRGMRDKFLLCPPYHFAGRVETALTGGGLCLYDLGAHLLTNIYIDGFNLYHRALKGTEFRWLDLRKLAETLFPGDVIQLICYFTALVNPRPGNPNQLRRQLVYLRALHTLPGFEAHFGTFRPRIKTRPLARPVPGLPRYVEILDSEEKGSDVNLAMRLLVDGFAGAYEQAVVVTNDSDLAGPIKHVRDELGLRVIVVNPDHRNKSNQTLENAATYVKRLWKSHLRRSQFPPTLRDAQGVITKPAAWD